MTEEELAFYAGKVGYSLICAASEVLGLNLESVNKHFHLEVGMEKDKHFIVVKEVVSPTAWQLTVTMELLQQDSDSSYYSGLKDLIKNIASFIPDEEKNIPVDNWPEPQWTPPEEEKGD